MSTTLCQASSLAESCWLARLAARDIRCEHMCSVAKVKSANSVRTSKSTILRARGVTGSPLLLDIVPD